MKALDKTAFILADIGAINWGLAAMNFNLVEKLLGTWPIVVTILYYIIALAGIWAIIKLFMK